MHVPTPCPGRENNAWRQAEATGLPHDLQPAWGDPVHCARCQTRAAGQLAELPELLAAIALEATHGTRTKQVGTIGRTAQNPMWPGEPSRILTDHIVGGLTALEDDIRQLRHLPPAPTGQREGFAATAAVGFLAAHLPWALEHHPAAAEAFDRDSANPASQIAGWHRAATRFTRRDKLRVQMAAPCPKCSLRSLAKEDGSEYIECANNLCGALLTDSEYAEHAAAVAAEEQYRKAAGAAA